MPLNFFEDAFAVELKNTEDLTALVKLAREQNDEVSVIEFSKLLTK